MKEKREPEPKGHRTFDQRQPKHGPSLLHVPFSPSRHRCAHVHLWRGLSMPHVIHVGPCNSPGGMRTVMRTLVQHPPEGWTASLLASHAPGRMAMVRAARKAARSLRSLTDAEPVVVHLHAASDWSLRRKLRLAAVCRHPVVLHLHSGDTARWLRTNPKRAARIRAAIEAHVDVVVALSDAWKEALEPLLGSVCAVPNPVDPQHRPRDEVSRQGHRLLVMGRDAPVKRRGFALEVASAVRQQRPSVHLHMTGGEAEEGQGWTRHGWLSEPERLALLQRSDALLLPSRFEGQPLAALEALACGVPVVADGDLVGLPDTVVRPSEATVEAWATAVQATLDDRPSPDVLVASVADHAVDRIAGHWRDVYTTAQRKHSG